MRRWDKELMMNTCSYQCVWDPQGDAVSRGAVSVSFQHWEGLCELAYDVQPRWQSLVCNLQSVGARVAEAHAGNTQHVFGPHLFRFVFPMRVLDPQQLRALNRETSHLDDQFCVVPCRRFVYMHRLVRFLFFFFFIPGTTASWCSDPSAPGWCRRRRWCQPWRWRPPGASAHAPSGENIKWSNTHADTWKVTTWHCKLFPRIHTSCCATYVP